MTNKEIERKAIRVVMKYEEKRKPGRIPEEVKRKGYDIKSNGRCIEVKGCKKEVGGWRMFQHNCFEALQKEKNYFVYIVQKLKARQPELYIIPRRDIIRYLKPRIEWDINLPVKEMKKWKESLNNKRTARSG